MVEIGLGKGSHTSWAYEMVVVASTDPWNRVCLVLPPVRKLTNGVASCVFL